MSFASSRSPEKTARAEARRGGRRFDFDASF
jgi:hypothetical protein